jgi:tetratricopeptide (TPR) repeat protein
MKVLSVFPDDQQVMVNLLSIVTDESPYEAVYLISNIADKNPNSSVLQAQTSVAFAKVNNYSKGIEYIKKALMLDTDNIEYQYNLAVLYDMNKEYMSAAALYKDLLGQNIQGLSKDFKLPVENIQARINFINKNYKY